MSDFPWLIGIPAFALGFIAFFIYFERRGLLGKGNITLSRFVYNLGSQFPLSIAVSFYLFGAITWGAAVHFYWHWCPEGSISQGLLDLSKPVIQYRNLLGPADGPVNLPAERNQSDRSVNLPAENNRFDRPAFTDDGAFSK